MAQAVTLKKNQVFVCKKDIVEKTHFYDNLNQKKTERKQIVLAQGNYTIKEYVHPNYTLSMFGGEEEYKLSEFFLQLQIKLNKIKIEDTCALTKTAPTK